VSHFHKLSKAAIIGTVILATAVTLDACGTHSPKKVTHTKVSMSAATNSFCRSSYANLPHATGTTLVEIPRTVKGPLPKNYGFATLAAYPTSNAPTQGGAAHFVALSLYLCSTGPRGGYGWLITRSEIVQSFGAPGDNHAVVARVGYTVGGPAVAVRVGTGVASISANFPNEPTITTHVVMGVAFVIIPNGKISATGGVITALNSSGKVLSTLTVSSREVSCSSPQCS
jgi:hypothetical protein